MSVYYGGTVDEDFRKGTSSAVYAIIKLKNMYNCSSFYVAND
jgi:hypothetical protein